MLVRLLQHGYVLLYLLHGKSPGYGGMLKQPYKHESATFALAITARSALGSLILSRSSFRVNHTPFTARTCLRNPPNI